MKVLLQQNEVEAEFNSGDECGNIVLTCCGEMKMEIKQKKILKKTKNFMQQLLESGQPEPLAGKNLLLTGRNPE